MIGTLKTTFRRLAISLIVAVQILAPTSVLAEDTTPSDVPPADTSSQSSEATTDSSTPPPATDTSSGDTAPTTTQSVQGPSGPTGPSSPTGPSANTYTYNKDTGLWENDYYTWDPATGQTKPKSQQNYSYNPTTGQWDTTEWYYSPEAGKYLPNIISSPTNPSNNSITNTGPNSTNQIDVGGTNNATFDLFFDANISNKIGQMSKSGNATVQGNTLGGNALTGDATALVNLLNMIQSSWGQLGSQDIATFMANIDGNVTGDLYIDPSGLSGHSGNTNIDLTVNRNAAIHNNIDVDVASGNALVNGNTTGGNATSGDARAVINLLNLINSAIKSNKSFIGVLNIDGNFNGDILLPKGMLDSIISQTGPNSNNQINSSNNHNLDVTVADNKTINNNITTDVGSGNASVTDNTNGGSATSGKANSNVVLLNLTGKKVVAKDAVLVFVNVLGTWAGLIFNAPAGTNAVAITGPGSTNTINEDNNTNLTADITKNSLIDNDINASAHSGDATVSHNTTGGNAKSGDATVGVNALNMIDSEFDITDWFGVLFINVLGNWTGSFGVNTAAGNPAAVAARGASASSATASPDTFSFASPSTTTAHAGGASSSSGGPTSPTTSVISSVQTGGAASAPATKGATSSSGRNSNWWIAGVVTLIGALMLGGERLMTIFRTRQVA